MTYLSLARSIPLDAYKDSLVGLSGSDANGWRSEFDLGVEKEAKRLTHSRYPSQDLIHSDRLDPLCRTTVICRRDRRVMGNLLTLNRQLLLRS